MLRQKKNKEIMDVNIFEVEKQLSYYKSETIIHGHTHRPGRYNLPSGKKRIVLPDWGLFEGKLFGGGLLINTGGVHQLSL